MRFLFKTTIVLLFIIQNLNAQLYKSHDWDKNPTFYKLNEKDQKLPSVAIKEKYIIQYYMPSILTKNIKLFETTHSIIRVNTKKGIELHNKVYIPTYNVVKIIDIKARVITPDGKIKILDKNNIKEIKNVKNYGNFKIFAIEGVTKNSQLEYIYTLQKNLSSVGTVIAQKKYKVNECEIIIRRTVGVKIKVKSYNGFVTLQNEKVEGNKVAFRGVTKNIPAMIDEESATPDANRMKVSYFARPKGYFVDDTILWNNLENNLRNGYVTFKPKKYKVLVEDFKKYSNKNITTDAEKINLVCDYIHHNFQIMRERNETYNQLKNIIRSKQATEMGIIKVYSLLFNSLDIPFELVLTSNRFRHKFDSRFYSNLNIQEVLFYFPSEKKYIEPTYVNTYLDYAPYEYLNNEGLFISKSSRNFKLIETPPVQHTITNRKYFIKINTEIPLASVECNQKLSGYKGVNNRGAYKYFKKKDLSVFKNNTAAAGIDDVEFKSFTVKNEELINATKNIPFELNYTYSAESLIEEVGSNLILNIGKVIGPQNEFYQEVERVNPIEIRFPNEYQYTFTIEIPKGYKAVGLDIFKVSKIVGINGAEACKFISDYKIIDNKIIINATESYKVLKMSKDYYDGYKDVVNSAYDLSKKSILFEKIE